MTLNSQDIDRIVALVLKQLPPGFAMREQEGPSPHNPPPAPPLRKGGGANGGRSETAENDGSVLTLSESVVTGAILEERLGERRAVRISASAVLTPTARDVLRIRRIECLRGSSANGRPAAKWLAILSRTSPSVASVIDQLRAAGDAWEPRLSGTTAEATQQAVLAVCCAECEGVVVMTADPDVAACLANRNSRIRAAAISTVEDLLRVKRSLQPNCLAIDPAGRGVFELRNLLRTVGAGGPPKPPADWGG